MDAVSLARIPGLAYAHQRTMATTGSHPPADRSKVLPLALGALGIVFGDIGTSPLYAVKECFVGHLAVATTPDNILGVLSLIFWSLTIVVTVKYLGFILRADNKGEGGVFALLALLPLDKLRASKMGIVVILGGIFGAALLYGDGVITPAISVLSAMEGLRVAAPGMKQYVVVTVTVAILVGLFAFQSRGTAGLGRIFGPVMLLWFVAIGVLGLRFILQHPQILAAVNPYYAAKFFFHHGFVAFKILGAVVLCITGGEALYADMGHFGHRPIRIGWVLLVFPALLLSYFGQGALLLSDPSKATNPFYEMVPSVMLYPMIFLATLAAIIASQALISGAFSLTRQAVQLGYCPRVTIVHTSGQQEGQIYIPEVNWALALATLGLVLYYQESTRLAAMYGPAVTTTMAITSVLFYFVARRNWNWPVWKALPLMLFFLAVDIPFFLSNMLKFEAGGWFPLGLGLVIFTLMTTWRTGRTQLAERFARQSMQLELFLDDVKANPPARVKGTAVFMAASATGTPPVLLHHLKHNKVLHDQVVLLSILSADSPTVPARERVTVEELGVGFYRVVARYGFMQSPAVPEIMAAARKEGLKVDTLSMSYYLGRETLFPGTRAGGMMRWRKTLFFFMAKNSRAATDYFGIPPGRVVELGMQIDL